MTSLEGWPCIRAILASPIVTTGGLLGSVLALARPAGAADTAADPGAGRGFSLTLGAGAGIAPDCEGPVDNKTARWSRTAATKTRSSPAP